MLPILGIGQKAGDRQLRDSNTCAAATSVVNLTGTLCRVEPNLAPSMLQATRSRTHKKHTIYNKQL